MAGCQQHVSTCMQLLFSLSLHPPSVSLVLFLSFSSRPSLPALVSLSHPIHPSLASPGPSPQPRPPPPPAPAAAPRRSRLGCQVKCHRYMDGIVLRIPSASNNQQ